MTKAIIVHEEDVAPFSKGGRDFRVLLSPSLQHTKIAMGTADVYPGQATPCHSHATEDEAWYVISGRGIVMVDDVPIDALEGTVVVAPARSRHQLINTSQVLRFKCVVVFSPAGPEEAFIV